MSKAEGGSRKPEAGEPGASATGGRKSEAGGQKSEVGGQRSEVKNQTEDSEKRKAEGGRRKADKQVPLSTLNSQLSTLPPLVCSLVGLTALTLAAAHAPGRIRLLGLFAVAFGAVCGWGLARGAAYFGVSDRSIVRLVTAMILIGAAETGLTLESWRLYVVDLRKTYDPEASAEVVGGGQPFVPDSLLKKAREERQRALEAKSRLPAYLRHRVKNLGDWPAPWPVVFWVGEVILGTAAGVAVCLRSGGKPCVTEATDKEAEHRMRSP
jgi:hypothetical protein